MDRPNNIPPHLPVIPGSGLDVGRVRAGKPNQDNLGLPPEWAQNLFATKGRLYIVADGMGGAAGGQEASQVAVNTTFQVYYQDSDSDIARSLVNAIQAANAEVYRRGHSDPALQGMGTTIVAAVIRGDTLVVAHVGDSRAYLLRGSALHRLTQDHSWVQEQVDSGLLTHEQAARHEQRNVLSRNLGNEPRARPDVATYTLIKGDALLLCSDGLWSVVSDAEIAAVLQRQAGDPAAQTLIEMANQRGGPDNIAVIALHIGAPARRPAGGRRGLPLQLAGGLALLAIAGAAAFLGRDRLSGAGRPALTTATTPTSTATAVTAVAAAEAAGAAPTSTLAPVSTPETATPAAAVTTQTVPTPAPTTPAVAPETTTTPAYEAPTLTTPADQSSYRVGQEIRLEWLWDGHLGADEWFDVRVWQGDAPHYGVGWTKEKEYRYRLERQGTYFWSVAVIRGKRGKDGNKKEADLSSEAAAWRFSASEGGGGEEGGSGGKGSGN